MFELKTVQSSTFRALFEVLNSILTDINLYVDSHGLKISACDSSHVSLVYLRIEGSKLESFRCTRAHTVGLNIPTLYKILKTAKNSDTLSLRLEDGTRDVLEVAMSNPERGAHSKWDLKLLDLDDERLEIPDHESDIVVSMASQDFQDIMKDFAAFADSIRITVDRRQVTFACTGDSVSCEKTLLNSAAPAPPKPSKPKPKPAPRAAPKRLKRSKFLDDEAEESGAEEEEEEEPEEAGGGETEAGAGAEADEPGGRIPIRIRSGKGGAHERHSAEYALKYLILFAKATSLSNAVDIFVHADNYPIILRYSAASFGELRMCLAARIPDGAEEDA